MPTGLNAGMAHFVGFGMLAIAWFLVAHPFLRMLEWSGDFDHSFSLASDNRGMIAIVTGANSGIGKSIAASLAANGATVILACRSLDRGEQARREIQEELSTCKQSNKVKLLLDADHEHTTEGRLLVRKLDLTDLHSLTHEVQVGNFAEEFKKEFDRLDILVNNAGIGQASIGWDLSQVINVNFKLNAADIPRTKQGIELFWGVNYVGHFFLSSALMGHLKKAPRGRIVNLASVMHHWASPDILQAASGEEEFNGYEDSKLAMILFSAELQRRYEHTNVTSIAVNPGFVHSEIWRDLSGIPLLGSIWNAAMSAVALTPAQGAATAVAAATHTFPHPPPLYLVPYYVPSWAWLPFEIIGPFVGSQISYPRLPPNEAEVSRKLWDQTKELVARKTEVFFS